MFGNPRYASHMSTAFTEHVRRQQELEEKKRQEDAERQLCATKAEHAVIVYAWTRDGESPCIREFQAGFSWRYFIISHSILEALHLANLSPSVEVQLFHHGLKTWVCIDEGHVVACRCSTFLSARPLLRRLQSMFMHSC